MRDQIAAIVTDAYARASAERAAETGTAPDPSPDEATPLFGNESALDSMGLVSLVLDVEEQLSDQLNLDVTLMDEKALSRRRSPFRTIGTLTDYIAELTGTSAVGAATEA